MVFEDDCAWSEDGLTLTCFRDADGDGIPDGVEFKEGLNPLGDDRLDDLDFDGVRNGDEVQRHTNTEADDPVVHKRWA